MKKILTILLVTILTLSLVYSADFVLKDTAGTNVLTLSQIGNLQIPGNFSGVTGFLKYIGSTGTKMPLGYLGNLNVSKNLSVSGDLLFVHSENNTIGINTNTPQSALSVNGTINMSYYRIINVSDPVLDYDIMTKKYADDNVGGGSAGIHLTKNFTVAAGKTVTKGEMVFVDTTTMQAQSESATEGMGSEQIFGSGAPIRDISTMAIDEEYFLVAYTNYSGAIRAEGNFILCKDSEGTDGGCGFAQTFEGFGQEEYNTGPSKMSLVKLTHDKFAMAFASNENFIYSGGYNKEGKLVYRLGMVNKTTSSGYHRHSSTAISSGDIFFSSKVSQWNSQIGTFEHFVDGATDSSRVNAKWATPVGSQQTMTAAPNGNDQVIYLVETYDGSGDAIAFYRKKAATGGLYYKKAYPTTPSTTFSAQTTVLAPGIIINESFSATAISPTKYVVVYSDTSDGSKGKAVVVDISGPTIGAPVTFNGGATNIYWDSSIVNTSSSEVLIIFEDAADSGKGKKIKGTISGTTITFGTEETFSNVYTPVASVVALKSDKIFTIYGSGTELRFRMIEQTQEKVGPAIGIARNSATAGQIVEVYLQGISQVQSGLTAGSTYYGNSTGSNLITSSSKYRAGLALSATRLLINSNSDNANQYFGDMIFANAYRITEIWGDVKGLLFKNNDNQNILSLKENGDLSAKKIHTEKLIFPEFTPSSSQDESGETGEISWDNNYLYLKTEGGWTRKELESF